MRAGKQLALIAVLFTLIALCSAATVAAPSILSRTIILNEFCNRVEISGNVTILLSPELSDRVILKGAVTDVDMIYMRVKNRKLSIRAQRVKQHSAVTIIVPAALLDVISVNGDAVIGTTSALKMPRTRIILNGETMVNVKSAGNIKIELGDDYELVKAGDEWFLLRPNNNIVKVLIGEDKVH